MALPTHAILLLACVLAAGCAKPMPSTSPDSPFAPSGEWHPTINAADFSARVTNPYFTLTPGTKMVYEKRADGEIERVEVFVTDEKKTVMGVQTTVVWDRVWVDDELEEDTKDWFAQDSEGNVWYFGEDSKEISGGQVVSSAGSWEAGIGGALPGIVMKAAPKVGDSYFQEYYKGEAEDRGDVLALGESVAVAFGQYRNCLKTRDYSPLEPGKEEHKYYCAEVGNVVLEEEDGERVELVLVEHNAQPSPSDTGERPPLSATLTPQQARAVAEKEVTGTVTGVDLERQYGKAAYVVEIQETGAGETDVIVDANTGGIIAIERD